MPNQCRLCSPKRQSRRQASKRRNRLTLGPADPRLACDEVMNEMIEVAIRTARRTLGCTTDGSARACGVGDCPRLVSTLGDSRETSGPRIDRIPPTRPPWWRRRHRGVPARGPLRCPRTSRRMACGAHESARIASRRATRRRGLEDTTITRAGAATATSRNGFFDPQFLSYCSLWTTNEAKAPRTTAWSGSHANLVCQLLVAPARATHYAYGCSKRLGSGVTLP